MVSPRGLRLIDFLVTGSVVLKVKQSYLGVKFGNLKAYVFYVVHSFDFPELVEKICIEVGQLVDSIELAEN
jgi:hypothetical protein